MQCYIMGESALIGAVVTDKDVMGTEAESITATGNIVIIDAMVIVQKLNPLPAWVNNCLDLAKTKYHRLLTSIHHLKN